MQFSSTPTQASANITSKLPITTVLPIFELCLYCVSQFDFFRLSFKFLSIVLTALICATPCILALTKRSHFLLFSSLWHKCLCFSSVINLSLQPIKTKRKTLEVKDYYIHRYFHEQIIMQKKLWRSSGYGSNIIGNNKLLAFRDLPSYTQCMYTLRF